MNSTSSLQKANAPVEQTTLKAWHTPALSTLDIGNTQGGSFTSDHEASPCKLGS